MEDLTLISTFSSTEDATAAITVLTDYGIQYDLRSTEPGVDTTFGLSTGENSIELFVSSERAEQALHLLKIETYDPETLTTEGYDGYLLHFTDEELLEVVVQKGEWGKYDKQMAELLLADRGKPLDAEEKERLIAEYIKAQHSPTDASMLTLVFGYLFAAAGGIIGFAIGIALVVSKSTDPNGNRYHSYTKVSRMAGIGMVGVGVVSILLTILIASL